jgi:MFS transporter, FHS family, L-fucose permease
MTAPTTSNPRTDLEPLARARTDRSLLVLCLGLFFLWGLATVLIDILVPKLKGLFSLSWTEVLLTQFAFFFGYFVFSLPAGMVVSRIGYLRGIILGLGVMTAGCLSFAPAARMGLFEGFLVALFVMSAGITVLQVAANAVITIAGPAASAPARLTLAQAFNSLGTTIGPLIGAKLMLEHGDAPPPDVAGLTPEALSALRRAGAAAVQTPFLGIAGLLVLLLFVFFIKRDMLPRSATLTLEALRAAGAVRLLANARLMFGVVAIFAYVGAEVSIGSVLTGYLMQPDTLGATAMRAGQLISLYWGGAMVGRFIGAYALKLARPGIVLAGCALAAALLATLSGLASGTLAAGAILAVGLCNSIMFPTIFALSIEGLGDAAPRGSALLCMAIVGGAVVPLLTGAVADAAGLSVAFSVPIACYAWVAFFGRYAANPRDGVGLGDAARATHARA